MRKYRKFTQGGDIDPLEEYNKGENLDTTPGPKARRDSEEIVDETGAASKFRRNLETGDLYSEEPITRNKSAFKPTVRPTSKPTSKPAAMGSGRAGTGAPASADYSISSQGSRAVIPGGGRETEVEEPTPASRAREGMSDTAKKALTAIGPLSMIGLGVGYKAYKASDAAKRAQIARAIREGAESAPVTGGSTAARTTSETGRKFGPKAEMEAAESTMRGAVGRRDIQAKRAAKERAESAEGKSSVRTGSTGAPRSRNTIGKDEEMISRNFASGGKVRGSGCEQRGLRKCKVV